MPPKDPGKGNGKNRRPLKPPRLDGSGTSEKGETHDIVDVTNREVPPQEPPWTTAPPTQPAEEKSEARPRLTLIHNENPIDDDTSVGPLAPEGSIPSIFAIDPTDPNLRHLVRQSLAPDPSSRKPRWGVPEGLDNRIFKLVDAGSYSYLVPIFVALLCAWTGLLFALWASALGLVLGALVALGVIATNVTTNHLLHSGAGEALSILGVITGAAVGAGTGFISVYTDELFANPAHVCISLGSGAVLSFIVVLLIARFEETILHFRGARRGSNTEIRRLSPIVLTVAAEMRLSILPRILVSTNDVSGAWTYMRHIVLSEQLLATLDDEELAAVLAHEIAHWHNSDSVGAHMVWTCAFPVIALYNVASYLSGFSPKTRVRWPGKGFLTLIAWMLAWPCWLMVRFIISPVFASVSRNIEYERDAWVRSLGRGPGLISALRKLEVIETARSGWEAVLNATHPPTALRIDRLEPYREGDEDFQEPDIGILESPRLQNVLSWVMAFILPALLLGGLSSWITFK